jgi:hypothetical protein
MKRPRLLKSNIIEELDLKRHFYIFHFMLIVGLENTSMSWSFEFTVDEIFEPDGPILVSACSGGPRQENWIALLAIDDSLTMFVDLDETNTETLYALGSVIYGDGLVNGPLFEVSGGAWMINHYGPLFEFLTAQKFTLLEEYTIEEVEALASMVSCPIVNWTPPTPE